MIYLLKVLICFFLGISFVMFCVCAYRGSKFRHRSRRRERLTQSLLSSFYAWIYEGHISREDFSLLLHCPAKRLETRLISQLEQITNGHLPLRVERIVEWRRLDSLLLREARHKRGYCRAMVLKVLYMLPISAQVLDKIAHYFKDRNPYVRLYALLILINKDVTQLMAVLDGYNYELNDFELSQIAHLLRRKMMPLEICEQLLRSKNKSQVLLGLSVMRLMNIDSCRLQIIRLLPSKDEALRRAILRTLVVLGLPLCDMRIVRTVRKMDYAERKWFFRLAVGEGYTLRALRCLLDESNESQSGFEDYVVDLMGSFTVK